MLICTVQPFYRYSGLSTDTKPILDPKDCATFWETDTNKNFEYRGGTWHEVKNVVSLEDDSQACILYEAEDILYICTAPPGTLSTESKWQIKKFDTASLVATWANGNALFINPATSLAVVSALPYS